MSSVVVLNGVNALRAAADLRYGPTRALQQAHARHGALVIARVPTGRGLGTRNIVLVADMKTARAILQKPTSFGNMPLYPARGPRGCAHRRLRNGILGMNGDLHKHYRRLLTPMLTQISIDELEWRMRQIAESEAAAWPEGDRIDLTELVKRLSRRMSLELIFGESNLERGLEIARAIEKHVECCSSIEAALVPLDWPHTAYGRLIRQAERTEKMLLAWVRERRDQPPGPDMMSVILSAKDQSGLDLSDAEAAAQLWTLYGASFDTTAATLAWLLLLLAQHPKQGRRLLDAYRDEDSASGLPPEIASHAIREAMRLFTTAPFQARQVTEAVGLPYGDFELREGDHIIISACVINRSADAFESPLEFHPDRWMNPATSEAALLIFGSGPRACPGYRFATAVLNAALRAIWLKWRINIEDSTNIGYRTAITLSPKRADVTLRRQDGAFRVARVVGQARTLTSALAGRAAAGPFAEGSLGALVLTRHGPNAALEGAQFI